LEYPNKDELKGQNTWQNTNSSCEGEGNNEMEFLAPLVPEDTA